MRLLMCADPLRLDAVDPAFAAEYIAVMDAGFNINLISYETLAIRLSV